MTMANILGFVGVGVAFAALLFTILSLSLRSWQNGEVGTAEISVGLWKYCQDISGTVTCFDISDSVVFSTGAASSDLKAVKAMLIIALIGILASAILAVLKLVALKKANILSYVAGGISIVAGIFLIVAFGLYADQLLLEGYTLGAAFAMDIVAWLLAWIAGGLMIGGEVMNKS